MKSDDPKVGICMLSYGTPQERNNLIPYMTDIRHGRVPTTEEIAWLDERYTAIGQWEDERLRTMSLRQKEVLERLMEGYSVYHAYLHDDRYDGGPTTIEQAVSRMVDDGVERAVVIITAPFHSDLGTGAYDSKFRKAVDRFGLKSYALIQDWWRQPAFSEYWSDAVSAVTGNGNVPVTGDSVYIFTAHSLPVIGHDTSLQYSRDVYRAAQLIADSTQLPRWKQAWQSAGTVGTWLGPAVADAIEESLDEGAKRIVFVPFGFVSDHVEILYDNDIECRRLVEAGGAVYDRASMPNTDARFIQAMARAVTERIES